MSKVARRAVWPKGCNRHGSALFQDRKDLLPDLAVPLDHPLFEPFPLFLPEAGTGWAPSSLAD